MKQLFLILTLILSLFAGVAAQNNDVYVPLPKDNFDLNLNNPYTGIVYTNSAVHKSPMIGAWQYDSLSFVFHFPDSVNISSIKVIRYADVSQTVGDTSSTYGTVVSTNTGGKTYHLQYINSGFADKNARAGYLRVLTTFNSSGNPHAQYSEKYFMYAHGYVSKK